MTVSEALSTAGDLLLFRVTNFNEEGHIQLPWMDVIPGGRGVLVAALTRGRGCYWGHMIYEVGRFCVVSAHHESSNGTKPVPVGPRINR